MSQVKSGDTVLIHYTGSHEDGTVFDTSAGDAPLRINVGKGEIIAGLEEGLIGMAAGETRTITIPCEKGYGRHMKERVFPFHKERLPEDFSAEVGQQIQLYRADGMPINARVVARDETSYTMDCNHPLAGKTLIFEVTLVEILSPDENNA